MKALTPLTDPVTPGLGHVLVNSRSGVNSGHVDAVDSSFAQSI
jgi:hypothetical protein